MTTFSPPANHPGSLSALLLYGNLQIPLVAAGLLGASPLWFDLPPQPALIVAGAAGAFLIYQIDRGWHVSAEDTHNHPDRVAWMRTHPRYLRFSSLIACAGIVLASFGLTPQTLLSGALLGLAGVLYLQPVFPGGRRLKGHWLIKPLAIAGAWAGGSVLLPALEAGISPGTEVLLLGLLRFGVLAPNVLVSDWPDREGDRRAGLRSLAQMVSEQRLRRIGQVSCLMALAAGMLLAIRLDGPFPALLELVGPMVMGVLLCRPLPASRGFFLLFLDLAAAWPVVPALVGILH